MVCNQEIAKLKKGINIFCDANTDAKSPRIWLSSGTTQEFAPAFDQIVYRPGAFVPTGFWREASLKEYSLIFTNEPKSDLSLQDIGSHIGVIRLPDEILAPLERILEEIRNSQAATLEECELVNTHPESDTIIAKVRNYIQRYCISSNRLELVGLRTTIPGLITVTSSYQKDISQTIYDGLHLDSWDRDPLKLRHKARNRICINLGCEDRFFMFINLTLMDMFHALGLSESKDIYKHYRGVSIGDEFMKRFPSYPVVKLRVGPGEAYIAPTENIIHDASTIGKKYSDITLTFLGYFGISPHSNLT
jgi:hypothetical protein